MNINQILEKLEENSNDSRKKVLIKAGANNDSFGVPLGYLRSLAKSIGINHMLGKALWQTKNTDARLLSVMLFDPKLFTLSEIIDMIKDEMFEQVLDDFVFRTLNQYEDYLELMKALESYQDDHIKRSYWALMILKLMHNDDVTKTFLDRQLKIIEEKLQTESPKSQWMMNRFLAEIGIRYADYQAICLSLGEKLGVYKDLKVPKGCTSAYVPNWINALVGKKK